MTKMLVRDLGYRLGAHDFRVTDELQTQMLDTETFQSTAAADYSLAFGGAPAAGRGGGSLQFAFAFTASPYTF